MDDSYQKVALGIIVAFPVLGGIAMILRFWSRRISQSPILIGELRSFNIDSVDRSITCNRYR